MVAKAKPSEANRRPDIEEWLNSYHVDWVYVPEATMADIDDVRSLRNQARLEPLDEGTIERYVIAWGTGAKFPPVVTNVGRGAKQTMISGNHRHVSGLKAGKTQMDRYEVRNAKPAVVQAMCREANNMNGLPPTEEERIMSAIFVAKQQGIPLSRAAEQYQVPLHKVQRKWNEASALERAQKLGLDMGGFMRLSIGVRGRLAPLKPDEIYAAAVNLAVKANLSVDDTKELVVDLNAVDSFAQKNAVLAARERTFRDKIQANLGGRATHSSKKPPTRRQRFQGAIGTIRTFAADVDGLLDAYGLNELPDLQEQIGEAIEFLEKLEAGAKARA